MTEPQTWAVIGLLFTTIFTMIGLVLATIRSQMAGLRHEIRAETSGLAVKLDNLDRDVQKLVDHYWKGGA